MMELKWSKQEYLEEVLKCEKAVTRLTGKNLSTVIIVCRNGLEKLKEVEHFFAGSKEYTVYREVFSVNRQALELLLEYSDVFRLRDYESYKGHCLALLGNLKTLISGLEQQETGSFSHFTYIPKGLDKASFSL